MDQKRTRGGLTADLILKAEPNSMWELACLRWHRLGVPDGPSCLHRRQASSHRSKALRCWRRDSVKLWERACLRWYLLVMPDTPRCLHRRQASSHRKAKHYGAGGGTRSNCGSGLAREDGGSVSSCVADTPPSRASPLPQFDRFQPSALHCFAFLWELACLRCRPVSYTHLTLPTN